MEKYCSNCGNKIKEGKFCPMCGVKIESDKVDINKIIDVNSKDVINKKEKFSTSEATGSAYFLRKQLDNQKKLMFTYGVTQVNLQNLIGTNYSSGKWVTITKSTYALWKICNIPYGLAKKVIEEAFYNKKVYVLDREKVKSYKRKNTVKSIIGALIGLWVGLNLLDAIDKHKDKPAQSVQTKTQEDLNSKPKDIKDIDYKEFYDSYSDGEKGKWVRINGKVSSINGNKDRITMREGLSGFDGITINLKQKRDDVKAGNYVTIVGKVGSKVLASVYLEDGYVEALGDEAKSNAKDYIQVDYKKLYKDYEENAIAADEKYKDKLIQVTGKIDKIFREVMGHPYVTFKVDKYFDHVQAVFDKDEEKNITKLKKGQTITVRGRCKGKTINVWLDECIIVKNK